MDELTPLSLANLPHLPAQIDRPRYARDHLRAGMVHIGLGNFHRAHQAWYTHRLMQTGQALDWAIIGAGVRPTDAAMRARLLAQDCLTTLIELSPTTRRAEVTGAMIDFVPVQDDNAPLIARMAQPDIRIVSLTVTEGGYYRDPATGGLDLSHPDIVHDAAHPRRPRTAFGAMVAALALRRAAGLGPFTGLSCDNLQGNGSVLRATVVGLARLSDPDLADWIDRKASFPNSMVDCIVPATGAHEIALARELGVADAAPVTHEDFRQWVIEDDFCAGRPDWDRAGATFSDRVHAYETMKIRILNGGHQVICGAGELLGLDSIAATMADPGIRGLFRHVAGTEIAPHVAPVPGMTPAAYIDLIARRFSNPAIADTPRRVAFDGQARHVGFLLPTIRDALAQGSPVDGLALVSAIWARYCAGTREDGRPIAPNDPDWDRLHAVALTARTRPEAWLDQHAIYGATGQHPRFRAAFVQWAGALGARGLGAVLDQFRAGRAA